jgi:arabinose-5-phosphate isomerase
VSAQDEKSNPHPNDVNKNLNIGRMVLRLEAEGLLKLEGALGDEFSTAVDAIFALGDQGRLVVSGMGKSGHVARKIAATLASTGTPALFVHAGEASHGDLGMITTRDAVLVLSNSGETPEVANMVNYCHRFLIPLLAMVGKADSSLGRAANITLALPDITEAGPLGLAPTTSTTMMLALGDALAVALLDHRGFSPEKFHAFHPGGKLGRKLVKVNDLCHTGNAVPLVPQDMRMSEVVVVMTEKSLGCAGVVDTSGKLLGIITDGDLRRMMDDNFVQRTAAEFMTPGPKTIDGDALASEALGRMNAGHITSLFVEKDGAPVGILHVHDCLAAGVA